MNEIPTTREEALQTIAAFARTAPGILSERVTIALSIASSTPTQPGPTPLVDGVFNEESLCREVARVWGEHGAHSEVLRDLLGRAAQPGEPEIWDDEPESRNWTEESVRRDVRRIGKALCLENDGYEDAPWFVPAEPGPIECATLGEAVEAWVRLNLTPAPQGEREPPSYEKDVRLASKILRTYADSLPDPNGARWLAQRLQAAAFRLQREPPHEPDEWVPCESRGCDDRATWIVPSGARLCIPHLKQHQEYHSSRPLGSPPAAQPERADVPREPAFACGKCGAVGEFYEPWDLCEDCVKVVYGERKLEK